MAFLDGGVYIQNVFLLIVDIYTVAVSGEAPSKFGA